MKILARNNELFVILLFCIGIFIYGLGINKITDSGSLSSQSFFIIGGLLFIFYHYKKFNIIDVKNLMVPIITFSIVFILGILTYFDDIIKHSFADIIRSVNQHIVIYFILFTLCYFVAKYAKQSLVHFFFFFFALLCLFEVLTMTYLGVKNGFLLYPLNAPFFFKAVFTYNIWILAPLAISITSFVVFKGKFKIISIVLLSLSIAAMLANSERSFIVAFLAMIFVPFIFWQYKYKRLVILALPLIWLFSVFAIYHLSKNFPPRWDFAHMIDNFIVVWNTPPIEMGKYDASCFDNNVMHFTCRKESIDVGMSDIQWEHSSLSRITMTKSTLLAFLDSPFKPHTINIFDIGSYLYSYYNLYNHQNRVYIDDKYHKVNGYNSPHNFAVSLLFAYGLFWFISIITFLAFLLYIFYTSIKQNCSTITRFVALSSAVFIVGISIQSIFDVIYPIILQPIFIMFGFVFGLCMRRD